jgi:hypothetical protein
MRDDEVIMKVNTEYVLFKKGKIEGEVCVGPKEILSYLRNEPHELKYCLVCKEPVGYDPYYDKKLQC